MILRVSEAVNLEENHLLTSQTVHRYSSAQVLLLLLHLIHVVLKA